MDTRKELSLNDSVMDILVTMSEGNPGAARVLSELSPRSRDGLMNVLSLDDMNIRGTQIWVAYSDHCSCDMDKFQECIRKRDPAMVETVNKEGRNGTHSWKAVPSGASFMKVRPVL